MLTLYTVYQLYYNECKTYVDSLLSVIKLKCIDLLLIIFIILWSNKACHFSPQIQHRKIELTLKDIQNALQPYGSGTDVSAYPSTGTWGNLCKDLQIPNTQTNRIRLKNACLAHLQVKNPTTTCTSHVILIWMTSSSVWIMTM